MEKLPDYYALLNVPRTATPNEIQTAWRDLVKRHHPDDPKNSRELGVIESVNGAYGVLSDPVQRKRYDLDLDHIVTEFSTSRHPPSEESPFEEPPSTSGDYNGFDGPCYTFKEFMYRFSKISIFSGFTGLAKMVTMFPTLMYFDSDVGVSVFYYQFVSATYDLIRMANRYVKGEIIGKPFSIFEVDVLYRLPKFALGKLSESKIFERAFGSSQNYSKST